MFFGLPVLRGFVLGNFKGCFDILGSFFGFVLRPFYLVILLISAIKRAHFSYSSQGFFCGSPSTALFFLVLFFLSLRI